LVGEKLGQEFDAKFQKEYRKIERKIEELFKNNFDFKENEISSASDPTTDSSILSSVSSDSDTLLCSESKSRGNSIVKENSELVDKGVQTSDENNAKMVDLNNVEYNEIRFINNTGINVHLKNMDQENRTDNPSNKLQQERQKLVDNNKNFQHNLQQISTSSCNLMTGELAVTSQNKTLLKRSRQNLSGEIVRRNVDKAVTFGLNEERVVDKEENEYRIEKVRIVLLLPYV
jgi:hypothetical protein